PTDYENYNDYYFEELKKSQEKNNIIFIDLNKNLPELKDEIYWLEDKSHPSEKAWDLIVPFIAEKLNIKY
ncbi:MAG: hypothetical protein LUH11_02610, partial [Candidatus Gastranaerophilales bacterium]|nr:hypothetical protein [Candidatus Gastranaerophilales bacterium]